MSSRLDKNKFIDFSYASRQTNYTPVDEKNFSEKIIDYRNKITHFKN